MSQAEMVAHKLYDTMNLSSASEEVKRHLMILILSGSSQGDDSSEELQIPASLEEAKALGAIDLEAARKELHSYVDELATAYDLQ